MVMIVSIALSLACQVAEMLDTARDQKKAV